MTKRLLAQTLTAAALITLGGNVLGRMFGFVREAVIAEHFGTSAILDTFILAFTLPELLAMILFTALPVALIPVISGAHSEQDTDRRLFWPGLVWFGMAFLMLSAVLIVLREHVLLWLAPDLPAEHVALGSRLVLILSLYVFFRGLEAYFRSWCFARKHFVTPATSTIIINTAVITAVFLLFDRIDIEALAWGWLVGSVILAIYNGVAAFRVVRPPFSKDWTSQLLLAAGRALLAVTLIETVSMLYPVVDRVLAARYLETGPISALRYAATLVAIPTGIFAAAFNIAAFPWIADFTAEDRADRLRSLYVQSVRLLIFCVGLVAVGVALFAPDIVRVALQRGQFDAVSVALTSGPVALYAIGMLFQAVYTFQMRFYYARRLLLRLGAILVVLLLLKTVLSLWLVGPMAHNGLALATALVQIAGFFWLTVDLRRHVGASMSELFGGFVPRVLVCLAAAAGLWLLLRLWWPADSCGTLLGLFGRLICLAIAGLGAYVGFGHILSMTEPAFVLRRFTERFRD